PAVAAGAAVGRGPPTRAQPPGVHARAGAAAPAAAGTRPRAGGRLPRRARSRRARACARAAARVRPPRWLTSRDRNQEVAVVACATRKQQSVRQGLRRGGGAATFARARPVSRAFCLQSVGPAPRAAAREGGSWHARLAI